MIFIYSIDTYHSSYFFYIIVVIVITQAKIKMNRTHNIDIKDILKDVEVCLKQGLERKVSSFFDDYTMFQRTHNEVLNLSIVKKMLHVNGSECKHEYNDHNDHNEHYKRSETMYHESIVSRYETELETLKNENKNLSIELEKYKKYLDFYNDNDDEESDEEPFQPLNLEITEKYSDMEDKNTDNNSSLQIQIENNIKNIVLNDADKDMVDEEEKEEEEEEDDTEEEEEEDEKDDAEEEEEEDEKDDAEEEEEEEVVVKKECVSAAVEIHSCSSDSEEEENLIKPLDNSEEEEEEEEVMPTFPTAQELTKLKEINHVVSNDTTEEVEVKVDVETEADANSVESENDVQEDTEEEEEEAQEAEAEAEADEEEEELFEVDINGVMYVSNDDEDGTIYSYVNEEVGDEIGKFIGKVAHVYKGANKGVYDRTKCKFNL